MSSPSSLANTLSAVGFISCDNAFVLSEEEKALVIKGLLSITNQSLPNTRLEISEPSTRSSGGILVIDIQAVEDIAEFFHNEHSTVAQSYEEALAHAQNFIQSALRASQPGAGSREELAIHFLACDAGSDVDWARPRFLEWKGQAHYGDCTKAPITCNRCLTEDAFKRADAILSLSIPANGREALLAAKEFADDEFSSANDLNRKNRISRLCDQIDAALSAFSKEPLP